MTRSSAGFTLIELLVVVTIGAVLSSLVILAVGRWQSDDAPLRQAQRFAAQLEFQCEQALFQGRPRALRLTAAGYESWQLGSSGWLPVPLSASSRPRDWAASVRPTLMIEGRGQALAEDEDPPQIVCQPLGERTPFELTLSGADVQVRLSGNAGGRLQLIESP